MVRPFDAPSGNFCAQTGAFCLFAGVSCVKKVAIIDMNGYLPVSFYGDGGVRAKGLSPVYPVVVRRSPDAAYRVSLSVNRQVCFWYIAVFFDKDAAKTVHTTIFLVLPL